MKSSNAKNSNRGGEGSIQADSKDLSGPSARVSNFFPQILHIVNSAVEKLIGESGLAYPTVGDAFLHARSVLRV